MVAVDKGSLVLVTGASGFIAVHIVKQLLEHGFKVRGTVRSAPKGEYIRNLLEGKGEFSYVLVGNIEKDGAFDEAVKGVDAVLHTASPFYMDAKSPEEIIGPAVKGTVGILQSLQKVNPSVKRVVVTSSVVAVYNLISITGQHEYHDDDWDTDSPKLVEEKGIDAGGEHIYNASKTLAERALWDLIKTEKPTWDAVAINPPYVFGEILHECDKPEKLNTSVAMFNAFLSGKKPEKDIQEKSLGNWVNVHEVALAHVRALEVPEAGGQRFIVGNGPFTPQDLLDGIHKHFSDLPNVPTGKPGSGAALNAKAMVLNGSKATKVLGVEYTSLDETIKQMGESLRTRFGP